MSFLLQISDPDEMRITIQLPGKYNPDQLDDGKRRLIDAYREAVDIRVKAFGLVPTDEAIVEGGETAK